MNRSALICLLIATAALPAYCEGTRTLIEWPGWTVMSTEDLYLGRKHTSFPLTYLFDGDPATTWVFSGTGKHLEGMEAGYAISLFRERDRRPVTVDGVWIMNGYNKSRELFLRNNRITELKIHVNGKFLKAVELSDSMGWHKISVPRQQVSDIKLEFTKFEKGRDDDVCVSEIALYDRGKQVSLNMPKVVEYTKGDGDCGCGQEYELIDRAGKRLASYSECTTSWSPSCRYVAVGGATLLVADTSTAGIVLRQSFPKEDWTDGVTWKGDRCVIFGIYRSVPQKKGLGGYKTSHYTKAFKLPIR